MAGSTTLVTLEPQPDFPVQDLSDTNAQLLELMLANAGTVELGHLGFTRPVILPYV